MITQITQVNETLLTILRKTPLEAVRISALLDTYGLNQPFFTVYWQDNGKAILAELDGTFFIIASKGANYEELSLFLRMKPSFAQLIGNYQAVRQIITYQQGGKCDRFVQMFSIFPLDIGRSFSIDKHPDLQEAFQMTHLPEEQANAWKRDMTARLYHKAANIYLIRNQTEPISICMISAQSGYAGLISSVYTKKMWRGNGYASFLTLSAAKDLFMANKTALLECKETLCPFYARLGFSMSGEIGVYVV
ncbi:MAG TPA: hypothetical protein DEP42_02555 [Ruminococcaceae bacterium]|nr:hypothetical protein [Oscillospiraceae bacterium]